MPNTARRGGGRSTRRAGTSHEEVEEETGEFPSQTAEEKRRIRRTIGDMYRRLQEFREKMRNGAEVDNDELKTLLGDAKDIVSEIKGTQEAIEDAKMFNAFCQIVREISEDTNVNEQKFNVDEYAEKIGSCANASRDKQSNIKMTRNQLLGLGEKFRNNFKRAPVFTFVLGAIDTEAGEEKTRRQRERKVGRERTQAAPTKTAIVERSQAADGQRTAKLVDSTMKILEKEYKNNRKKPVNYFKFVIDPESFGRTVENMFHVSFLVKQRKVELSVCPEIGLPMLEPVSAGSEGGEEGESEGKNQAIISLSWSEWEELKEALDVSSASIVHKETAQ